MHKLVLALVVGLLVASQSLAEAEDLVGSPVEKAATGSNKSEFKMLVDKFQRTIVEFDKRVGELQEMRGPGNVFEHGRPPIGDFCGSSIS